MYSMRSEQSKLATCGLYPHDERKTLSPPTPLEIHQRARIRLPSSLCKPSLRTYFDWEDSWNDDYSKRPVLLDLFSGAGGAALGYYLAGFRIVGIDIVNQPHYPFEFHQADALTYPLDGFDAYHASPPCWKYQHLLKWRHPEAPDLIPATRERLKATGNPYIIENVVGAPLINPIRLCGVMFGLKTIRHRLFESNIGIPEPVHRPHNGSPRTGEYITIVGHGCRSRDCRLESWREAMGINWMNKDELCQAVPPVYAEFLGRIMLERIKYSKKTR